MSREISAYKNAYGAENIEAVCSTPNLSQYRQFPDKNSPSILRSIIGNSRIISECLCIYSTISRGVCETPDGKTMDRHKATYVLLLTHLRSYPRGW
jgi:hypothetical protein